MGWDFRLTNEVIIMLSVLISGTIASDPKHGKSASGTVWSNCVVRVPCGQNRETGDAENAFVQVACFGSHAEALARLGKGDSISAQGQLKPTLYQKDGQERHGLSLTAQAIITAYGIAKKRGDYDGKVKRNHGSDSDREQNRAYDQFARGAKESRADFDDPINF
jgi:single-stranded DNA-binding protein